MPEHNAWLPCVVEAPSDARCMVCGHPVEGIDYIWRAWFPLLADMRVEFTHPTCEKTEARAA